MSGYFKNRFSTATAIGTGIGYQPVLFDYDTGDLVVKIQVAGAANFQARGKDGNELKASYDAQYGKTAPSMAGRTAKVINRAAMSVDAAATRAAEAADAATHAAEAAVGAAATRAASGIRSAARGTAQRVAGVANVLWRGKRALAPQVVGGRSRKNRKNRRACGTRRNRRN